MALRVNRMRVVGLVARRVTSSLGRRVIRAAVATDVRTRPFASLPAPPETVPVRRVVVTGIGMVTPLGIGTDPSWSGLMAGKCGVRALDDEALAGYPCQVAAKVPFDDGEDHTSLVDRTRVREQGSPYIAYAMAAADEAIRDSWMEHLGDRLDKTRVGVAIGSSIGGYQELGAQAVALANDERGYRRMSPFFVPRVLVNMAAGQVSIKHGFQGPNHAAATACASGAHAIGDAFNLVKHGEADIMIAGGTDAGVGELTLAGFCRARALSSKFNDDPAAASRPFDAARNGFVLAEGAACLVLEELEHAQQRGAPIYAEVRGYGQSGEGFHITAPAEDGSGSARAMQAALDGSGLAPHHVDYVNAHATSTPLGDVVEARGMATVFGDHLRNVAVSSTKGAVGHLLGAAGAVEAAFSVLSIVHDMVPPTLNLDNPDPALPEDLSLVGGTALHRPVHVAMSNSFGFGGTNCSLVFATAPPVKRMPPQGRLVTMTDL